MFWTTYPCGRKIHFSRENCVRDTKSGHENWPRLLIVRILLHRSSLWKVRHIPETFLVSHQQKISIKSNWLSHIEGLNTLGVASDGCNRLRSVLFVDAPDLGAVLLKMMQRTSECGTKNDATDFLVYYRIIAFCWHIIEVRTEWESELAS